MDRTTQTLSVVREDDRSLTYPEAVNKACFPPPRIPSQTSVRKRPSLPSPLPLCSLPGLALPCPSGMIVARVVAAAEAGIDGKEVAA